MKFNSIEEKYALELSISVLKKETPPSVPDGISFEKMFDFCEKHSITVLVYHALKKVPDISIDDALNKKYNESYLKAMGREAKQEFEYRRIAKRFEDNNIDYMPLKGCIMKYLYPLPFLRHMVDMDILIREDDLTKAGNIMLEDGYSGTVEKTLHYHNSFTKKPIFDVELHRSLLADHYIHISKFIDGVWDRAIKSENSNHLYEMTPEDFYIFMIIHLANHFIFGGVSLKLLFDIRVFLNAHPEIDMDYINSQLDIVNLRLFGEKMKTITDLWFDGGESDELYDEINITLMNCAGFGKEALMFWNDENRDEYFLRLVFPTVENMKKIFPVLEKAIILLPFCYIFRLFRAVFKRRDVIKDENDRLKSVPKKDVNSKKKFFSDIFDK